MKRKFILILIMLMTFGSLMTISNVQALDSKVNLTISADKKEVKTGDEITYTIAIQTSEAVSTIQLDLDIPTGLTYIENSGTMKLNVSNDPSSISEFIEEKKSISVFDFDTLSFDDSVTLATFKCIVNEDAKDNFDIGIKYGEIVFGYDFDNLVLADSWTIVKDSVSVKDDATGDKTETGNGTGTGDKTETGNGTGTEIGDKTETGNGIGTGDISSVSTPKTGDDTNIPLYVSLLVFSIICFVIVIKKRTKESKENHLN